MVLSFSCTQNHLQIFSNARSSEAGPGTNTYVDCSSGESNRALAAVPRRSAWCALKLLGAGRLTSYIHIYPGLVSFGARNVHTLLQAQPRLQNQVLRLFASSIRTKFVEKLNQKPIRSKCQKTRCRSRSSPVVKTRGRDDPKNQKGTFPTRGLEGRDITRGQYFQGAHSLPGIRTRLLTRLQGLHSQVPQALVTLALRRSVRLRRLDVIVKRAGR